MILRYVVEPTEDSNFHVAAAFCFRDLIHSRWSAMPMSEKDVIRPLVVSFLTGELPKVKRILCEALTIMVNEDFPECLGTFLTQLLRSLNSLVEKEDYASGEHFLISINSLFDNFRHKLKFNDLPLERKENVSSFLNSLIRVFTRTADLIHNSLWHESQEATLIQYLEFQRLCCMIICSLSFHELPQVLIDHMDECMTVFWNFLTVRYPLLEEDEDFYAIDGVRGAVCQTICVYVENDEVVFKKHISRFVEAVSGLLRVTSASPDRETITVEGIKFLNVVSTSSHYMLFEDDDMLEQIFQNIVIPTVILKEEDVEEYYFDMDYMEFIRWDMEKGGDARRRIACELLKGIGMHYKDKVKEKVRIKILYCLNLYVQNPIENWRYKEFLIYLGVFLAAAELGGSSVSNDLIDIEAFVQLIILPELQSKDLNTFPYVKASALKSFTMLVNDLPKSITLPLLPCILKLLASESNVVHSYAASCIEKTIIIKDNGTRARFTLLDFSPSLSGFISNLFRALMMPKSEENEYVMKCILRVIEVAEISPDVASDCLTRLTNVLNRVCQNAHNPSVNYYSFTSYVFKSVSVLIRRACEGEPNSISVFESSVFPSLQKIIDDNLSDLFPYAFQLFSQLVDLNGPQQLADSMDAIQEGLFQKSMEAFWVPRLKLTTGSAEVKLASLASIKLMCVSSTSLDSKLRGEMLDSIVSLLSRPEEEKVAEEEASEEHLDPKGNLVDTLVILAARSPGVYPQLIEDCLEESNKKMLLQLCSSYNRTIA